jgi:hypothetical protein
VRAGERNERVGQCGLRPAQRPRPRHSLHGVFDQLIGAAVLAHHRAVAEDAALAVLAVPAAAVVARAGNQPDAPALLCARQQPDDRVVHGVHRAGQPQRGDGIQRGLALRRPVVACHAKAGAGDGRAWRIGHRRCCGGERLQHLAQPIVADDLVVARPRLGKSEGIAGFIGQQRVALCPADINAQVVAHLRIIFLSSQLE